jgi:hypothetical protein
MFRGRRASFFVAVARHANAKISFSHARHASSPSRQCCWRRSDQTLCNSCTPTSPRTRVRRTLSAPLLASRRRPSRGAPVAPSRVFRVCQAAVRRALARVPSATCAVAVVCSDRPKHGANGTARSTSTRLGAVVLFWFCEHFLFLFRVAHQNLFSLLFQLYYYENLRSTHHFINIFDCICIAPLCYRVGARCVGRAGFGDGSRSQDRQRARSAAGRVDRQRQGVEQNQASRCIAKGSWRRRRFGACRQIQALAVRPLLIVVVVIVAFLFFLCLATHRSQFYFSLSLSIYTVLAKAKCVTVASSRSSARW